MRLMRIGEPGRGRPALIDDKGQVRGASDHLGPASTPVDLSIDARQSPDAYSPGSRQ